MTLSEATFRKMYLNLNVHNFFGGSNPHPFKSPTSCWASSTISLFEVPSRIYLKPSRFLIVDFKFAILRKKLVQIFFVSGVSSCPKAVPHSGCSRKSFLVNFKNFWERFFYSGDKVLVWLSLKTRFYGWFWKYYYKKRVHNHSGYQLSDAGSCFRQKCFFVKFLLIWYPRHCEFSSEGTYIT